MSLRRITKGSQWQLRVVVGAGSNGSPSLSELIDEMTGATATAVLDDAETGDPVQACTAVVSGTTRTILVSLTAAQTTAMALSDGGLRLDVRYTPSGETDSIAVPVRDHFTVQADPWE